MTTLSVESQILTTYRFECKACGFLGDSSTALDQATSEGYYHQVSCVPVDPFLQSEDGSQLNQDSVEKRKMIDIPGIGYLGWMYAGKCYVTFLNTKINERFTYCIKKAPPSDKYPDSSSHWVSVLTGPNNTDDYSIMGTVFHNTDGDKYVHNRKYSNLGPDAPSVKAFEYVFQRLLTGALPSFIEIWHEGRCSMCGHLLTDPDSIRRGIGPTCLGKFFG